MRRFRERNEKSIRDMENKIDSTMADIAHDLKMIEQAVMEIRDGGSENRAENIDIALGLISELIAAVE